MIEIIGAGFCRSGTMSTRKALVDLGCGPCFHMENVIKSDLVSEFLKYFDGDKEPLLTKLEDQGFKSTLDFPIIAIFDDLLKVSGAFV